MTQKTYDKIEGVTIYHTFSTKFARRPARQKKSFDTEAQKIQYIWFESSRLAEHDGSGLLVAGQV